MLRWNMSSEVSSMGAPPAMPAFVDQHIKAAVAQHGLTKRFLNRRLAGDIGVHKKRTSCPKLRLNAGDSLCAACAVDIGHDDVRAVLREAKGSGATDAAGGAGDERDLAGEVAVRRGQLQLVEFERPVFNVVGLVGRQADEAAQRFGVADDGDGAVVKLPADIGVG